VRRAVLLLVAAALLGLPTSAPASATAPFAHPCTAQNGVRFCPTVTDSQRVPSFDGVPLDVDVTLPATGSAPYPTIVILHGFPGSKASFESTDPNGKPTDTQTFHYNNTYFAQQGYAVLTYSARGFGRSCGVPASRTPPACDRGWFHFADQRFELRDTQYLLGKLVNQGVTDRTRIGVTGTSYGGLQTMQLAFLKNRIRTLGGGFAPWTSPGGESLHVAVAWPRWGSSDFVYAVAPNGRFVDFGNVAPASSGSPIGVAKKSVVDALYIGGTVLGYLAPPGADSTADLKTWRDTFFAGEPYGAKARAIARQFQTFKSTVLLTGKPAPLLVMNGWTDPVFPAEEALKPYNRLRSRFEDAAISLQLGDLGHFRAGNPIEAYRRFNDDGGAFLGHYLKGLPGGPAPGSVTAFVQGCPKGTLGSGPIEVSSWSRFARGSIAMGTRTAHTLTAGGGDDATGNFFNPVSNNDPCSTTGDVKGPGTVVLRRTSPGFTLAGPSTVTARIENSGAFGQIDARLFDVVGGKERLIDTGVYRLTPGQNGRVAFQLFGNAYRFPAGDRVKLELLGRNEPSFLADKDFHVKVSGVHLDVPTRDRPSRQRGIGPPPERE
jgi:pimeloyl-ACP methyl ester carboxylesterase